MAYQGFVSGCPERDAYAVRLFTKNNLHVIVNQSFAKNFGLYGQRVGCVSMPCRDNKMAVNLKARLGQVIRQVYSNNPRYGSDLIKTILKSKSLQSQWLADVKTMADRIAQMRQLLLKNLQEASVKNWDFITQQRGMFAFTPLSKEQVIRLRNDFGVYMLENGRISLSGINTKNV